MTEKPLTRAWTIERRHVVWLALLAVGFFVLVPRLIGFRQVLELIRLAQPGYLALAVAAELLRYLASAASTLVLARVFHVKVPFVPTVGAFLAGAAANRTFSTAGAPGMLVRFDYLDHRGLHPGAIAVVFLIEDIVGTVIGALVLLVGIVATVNALPNGTFVADASAIVGVASPLLFLVGWFIYRRRSWVERGVHGLARLLDRPLEWLFGRPVLRRSEVERALDEFYAGMALARRAPWNVLACILFNGIRYAGGAAALYFSFLSLGRTIAPAALILVFTSVSLLSSISAVPGEVAIMSSSFAILSLAFGVPGEIALMALLLSRAVAFWLPLPLGYGALWLLRRRGEL